MKHTSVYSLMQRIQELERMVELWEKGTMSDQWRAMTAGRIAELDGGDRHQLRQLYRQLREEVVALEDEDLKRRIIQRTRPYRESESKDIKAALRVLYLICLDDDLRERVAGHSAIRAADPDA